MLSQHFIYGESMSNHFHDSAEKNEILTLLVEKLLSSCEKYFLSEHEKRWNEVNCRVNWWWTVPKIHCVMQQMKNFHLDSGRSQIYSKAFWQAVHHGMKSRKLIYNLFSFFNLFSFVAYIFNKLQEVCLTIFHDGMSRLK